MTLFKKLALLSLIAFGLMIIVTYLAVTQFSQDRIRIIAEVEKARIERDTLDAITAELPNQLVMRPHLTLIIYSTTVPMKERVTLTINDKGEKTRGTLDVWPENVPKKAGKYTLNGSSLDLPNGTYIAQVVSMDLPTYNSHDFQDKVSDKVMETYGEDFAEDYANQIMDFMSVITRSFFWLLAGLTAAYFILGRSFKKRLSFIDATLSKFGQGDHKSRLPKSYTQKSDELGRLSKRVNATLDKTDRLISGLDSMSSQISHELKDELQSLKKSLSHVSDPNISDSVDDMQRLVDEVLELVRLETDIEGQAEPFYLSNVVLQATQLFSDTFEDANIKLVLDNVQASTGPIISGREKLIQRMVANLLTNILRYAPKSSEAKISISFEGHKAILSVNDEGPGVPSTSLEQLSKMGRQRKDGLGYGSGLRFVRAVCVRHGAKLTLHNTEPGLSVVIEFPISK